MIRAEYLRFLQTLTVTNVADDVRKIANLVLNNLDTLIPLSTSQGQRIKKVIHLAQDNWPTISTNIQPVPEQVTNQTWPINQLKNLSVGPFRGFAKREDFDLASRLVLIYGPNGTGKSSFCEALEYGLLGNVAEAESKRFRNQQEYLTNAHTSSFKPPVLTGTDSQGNDVPIVANEALYRFCFVEKNRIDNFSRIAAQTPAKQSELISTLFGLDAFTDFVRNFTDAMDEKYIDLHGIKANELKQKRQALAGSQELLQANSTEMKTFNEEESALAKQYREGCTFPQMISELNGTKETAGLIQRLDDELQKPIATKSNLTIIALQTLRQSIETNLSEFNIKQQELINANQEVSFKQLYEAVTQVQKSSPEHCPACKTPLVQVTVNPFAHADTELKKLQHLSELQETIKKLNTETNRLLSELSQIINTCCARFDKDNQLSAFQVSTATIQWWNLLHQQLNDQLTPWNYVEIQVTQLESIDKKIDLVIQTRAKKQTELRRLREFDEKIVRLKTRRETAEKATAKANEVIEKFNTENKQLIVDVEAEKTIVVQNKAIANAYSTFVQKLNAYKDKLPAQLVADLGEMVVMLYNAFNRNDAWHEQLAVIRLPLKENQRLEISFKNSPQTFFDALHILSEGHIRCMGLAILTAKNIKENCPLLIFDDPVNAIDDEHRQAIRETLFADEFFKRKQLILAIHGEEFFNRTHQIIGKEAATKTESYLFSSRDGDYHIQVNSLKRPKNYVLAARELYKTGEYRDSLLSSRRALEYLCEKAWYHYGKHSDKNDKLISVSRRAPNLPWDLRNLAENLKSKFDSSKANIPNKLQIINSFSIVLGLNAQQPPWTYLNKGTHDETDLPEFDEQTVNQIVTSLEQLDIALG
ncbi:MAG: chromosome segregation protein SMC [Nitrosomonas sp.]|uniref:AAA family ATPase n=1 Tax=Nitrosomonas sp. TaxID=42353 RepID=UPI0032EF568A